MRHVFLALTALVVVILLATPALAGGSDLPTKWSQPPEWVASSQYPGVNLILGWDQISMVQQPIVADDFMCENPLPITDIHWWGSYPGMGTEPVQRHPDRFLIRFWTDVPIGSENPNYSHPGDPIWDIVCENYTVEEVGYDINPGLWLDPGAGGQVQLVDRAYQYNQRLTAAEEFHQTVGQIYWISIQAQYDGDPISENDWGWKTRPHFWNDDAVSGGPLAGAPGFWWEPISGPDGASWDMAYELTVVPEPAGFVLLGAGLVSLLVHVRRRRKS